VTVSRPDVFEFLSFRAYLSAWFDWRKAENPRYSHRLFARKAGHGNPSLLKHVIAGTRNLTDISTEGFVNAMQLAPDERRFFRLLIEADQGGTPSRRAEAMRAVLQTKRFREAQPLEAATLQVLSDPVVAAIHEMARTPDFCLDPVHIAARFRSEVTVEQVEMAVEALQSLGALVEADGQVKVATPAMATDLEVVPSASIQYHLSALESARTAILEVPADERQTLGFTVAMDPDEFPEMKRRMLQVLEEMAGFSQGTEPKEVYQFALTAFPVTRSR